MFKSLEILRFLVDIVRAEAQLKSLSNILLCSKVCIAVDNESNSDLSAAGHQNYATNFWLWVE